MRRLAHRCARRGLAAGLASCACVVWTIAAAHAAPATPPTSPANGTGAAHGSYTPLDSLPTPSALEVLRTIPEPLPEQERVPPPRGVRVIVPPTRAASALAAAPAAAAADTASRPAPRDTSSASPSPAPPDSAASAPDTTVHEVPVPEPTQPLGDKPGSLMLRDSVGTPTMMDSTGTQAKLPNPPPPATPRLVATAPAMSDTCWRLQIAAFPERARAAALSAAAQSQLLLPMVVEHESGRWKVRTRDCLASSAAADSLKRRAVASGFRGAFRVGRKRP